MHKTELSDWDGPQRGGQHDGGRWARRVAQRRRGAREDEGHLKEGVGEAGQTTDTGGGSTAAGNKRRDRQTEREDRRRARREGTTIGTYVSIYGRLRLSCRVRE